MTATPHHASKKIDGILDRLNGIYDLQLPKLHGPNATAALNNSADNAVHCSLRIRFLCFRAEEVIDSSIDEFEDEALHVFKNWNYKPSQEKGTLPSLPKNESFLRRDIISRNGPKVTDAMRSTLLQILRKILDEEYKLASESRDYQRTSSQSLTNVTSRSASYVTATPERTPTLHQVSTSTTREESGFSKTMSNKRRKVSGEAQDGKRTKTYIHAMNPLGQITGHFSKVKNARRPVTPNTTPGVDHVENTLKTTDPNTEQPLIQPEAVISFNTALSPTDSVFSARQSFALDSSNNTSLMSCDANASQDLFDTQDHNACMADASFCSELYAADVTTSATTFSFDNLDDASPFGRAQHLPTHLQFWLRWEIYRVAQSAELSPIFLVKELESHGSLNCLTYDQFWSLVGSICQRYKKPIPARSDVRSWMEGTGRYESPDGKSAYFTFDLDYVEVAGPYLWTMTFNPIKVDKGNRMHQKYGPDRHITGFLKYFDKSSLPKWVTQRKDFVLESFNQLATWLTTTVHHIAGREWRAYWIEPESKRRSGERYRQKLSLFAVDGIDFKRSNSQSSKHHTPLSVANLVNWHLSLENNLDSTSLKLFSRLGLGLSKTVSTIVLKPAQFHYLPDQHPVMNDGCALMSMDMARAVWDKCGDGTNELPSAFQGRISGAKGLWIIDYQNACAPDDGNSIWMQVSESQLKIKPHPRDRLDADEIQRTFVVLKWSRPCAPGHLNIQLINILADRGVPRATLRQVVLEDIEEYIEASRGAMRDPRLLAAWLQEYHIINRHEQPVSFEYGLPDGKEEEARFLVQSGFDAEICTFLRQNIIGLMTQRLKTYVEKLRIEIPHSTSVFCVPDPYGVLEENEVFLGFSTHWEDPKTGLKETALIDIDVLVARNPAALASDIQKRRAVYKHDLRHFKDVIIFPTKGKEPLASLLSGGDYDGDTVTVIWDPKLVNSFRNVEKPQLPDEIRCGLSKDSQRVRDIISTTPASDADIDNFLVSCIKFNAKPSRLGICTTELAMLVYSGVSLSDHGSILLAALAGWLVDANKQGLSMDDASWFRIRRVARADRKIYPLAYKDGEDHPRRWNNGECVNIIDYLKFNVAEQRKDDVLSEFEKKFPDRHNYDRDLSLIYNREKNLLRNTNDDQSSHRAAIIADLTKQIKQVCEEWRQRTAKRKHTQHKVEKSEFPIDVRFISNMIKDIVPLRRDCDIYHDFIREQKCCAQINNENHTESSKLCEKGSRWSLLRASAMYALFWRNDITWWTVGDELGRIKAKSLGATREIVPVMHHVMKFDTKLIKRVIRETFDTEDDDSDDE